MLNTSDILNRTEQQMFVSLYATKLIHAREKTIQLTSPTAVIQKPLRNNATQINSLFQENNTVPGQAGTKAQCTVMSMDWAPALYACCPREWIIHLV